MASISARNRNEGPSDPQLGPTSTEGQRLHKQVDRELADLLSADQTTARQLLVAATKVFAARGFHASTTREICRLAGLSSAGLYVYFRSKEELLFEISRLGHQGALDAVRAELAGIPSAAPIEQLQTFVITFVAFHARHHTLARVCQYELPHLSVNHYAEIANIRHQITAITTGILTSGVEDNSFSVRSLRATTTAILSLGIDVARWFQEDRAIPAETLAAEYAELARRLVASTEH